MPFPKGMVSLSSRFDSWAVQGLGWMVLVGPLRLQVIPRCSGRGFFVALDITAAPRVLLAILCCAKLSFLESFGFSLQFSLLVCPPQ